jgi:MOSC domain-containing protein YiiM
MTTLAQADLPADAGVLRTAAKQNQSHVGVYADVLQAGLIRRGDAVRLIDA